MRKEKSLSKKSDVEKYTKVVNSCQNTEQLLVAQQFGANLYAKYGETLCSTIYFDTPFLDKLVDIQNFKAKKLKHEREVRGKHV